jgi:hypothetical protein
MERIEKRTYSCKPQQLALLTRANTTVVVAGRGSGKTTNILAQRLYFLIHSMPRCTINFLAETYQQLLLTTLKELFFGWQKIGFMENVHYVVRKLPPKNWPRPYRMPLKTDFSIFTYNGTCIQLLSQDVFNNGGSAQAMVVDEARKIKKDDFDQVYLAMRDDTYFKGNPDYMSITLTTDQPISPSEQWVFEYEKLMDEEQIELIQYYQIKQDNLLHKYYNPKTKPGYKKLIQAEINKTDEILRKLRKNSVYFLEYSTLDNFYAIGEEYINNLKRNMTDHVFEISVLNKRARKPLESFYPNFDILLHTYNMFDYNYLGSIKLDYKKDSYTPNCLQDGDINPDMPIDVALDCGGTINVLTCGQFQGNVYRVLKGFHVKPPLKVSDLAKQFVTYYEPHKTKEIRVIHDQTDIPTNAVTEIIPIDSFMDVLKQSGWLVIPDYRGAVPSYMSRFNLINNLLSESVKTRPRIRINKHHCDDLIISIESTELKQGKTGYEKEKKYERNKTIAQEHTTHYSDSFDKLVYFSLIDQVRYSQDILMGVG